MSETRSQALALRLGDEAAQVGRVMHDVGIGQQQVGRLGSTLGRAHALLDRPHLPAPAGGQGCSLDEGKKGIGGALPYHPAGLCRRAVLAAVVDQDQGELAGIVLAQKRGERGADDVGLVARRHHGHDLGPGGECRRIFGKTRGRVPEAVPQEEIDEAGRKRERGKHCQRHRHSRWIAQGRGQAKPL